MDDYLYATDTLPYNRYIMGTPMSSGEAWEAWIRDNALIYSKSPDSTKPQDTLSLIRDEIHQAEVRIKAELKDELITSIIPDCIKESARLLNEGYSEAEIQAELMKLFFSV